MPPTKEGERASLLTQTVKVRHHNSHSGCNNYMPLRCVHTYYHLHKITFSSSIIVKNGHTSFGHLNTEVLILAKYLRSVVRAAVATIVHMCVV